MRSRGWRPRRPSTPPRSPGTSCASRTGSDSCTTQTCESDRFSQMKESSRFQQMNWKGQEGIAQELSFVSPQKIRWLKHAEKRQDAHKDHTHAHTNTQSPTNSHARAHTQTHTTHTWTRTHTQSKHTGVLFALNKMNQYLCNWQTWTVSPAAPQCPQLRWPQPTQRKGKWQRSAVSLPQPWCPAENSLNCANCVGNCNSLLLHKETGMWHAWEFSISLLNIAQNQTLLWEPPCVQSLSQKCQNVSTAQRKFIAHCMRNVTEKSSSLRDKGKRTNESALTCTAPPHVPGRGGGKTDAARAKSTACINSNSIPRTRSIGTLIDNVAPAAEFVLFPHLNWPVYLSAFVQNNGDDVPASIPDNRLWPKFIFENFTEIGTWVLSFLTEVFSVYGQSYCPECDDMWTHLMGNFIWICSVIFSFGVHQHQGSHLFNVLCHFIFYGETLNRASGVTQL